MHFVLIGGLLFVLSESRRLAGEAVAPPPATSPAGLRPTIVFSQVKVRQLYADFVSQFVRSPSREEFVAFVHQAADDEMLETEARRLALGFSDPSIRMWLVRKMRAVSENPGGAEDALYQEALDLGLEDDLVVRGLLRAKMRLLLARAPGDDAVREEDVRAYVERHRDRFVRVEAATISHVFLSQRIHGERLREDAEATLRELRARPEPPAGSEELSDPFPLGLFLRGWSRLAVARHFGDEFAASVMGLEPGRWEGPIRSALGLHLVWVHERIPGAVPPLHVLWPGVVREIAQERAAERVARGLEELRSRYEIRIEPPAEMSGLSFARAM